MSLKEHVPVKISDTYTVFYSGKLISGVMLQYAIDKLAQTSGIHPDKARLLLSRKDFPIKKQASKQQAGKVLQIMQACGLECYVKADQLEHLNQTTALAVKKKLLPSNLSESTPTPASLVRRAESNYSVFISGEVLSGFKTQDVIRNLRTKLNISNEGIKFILQNKGKPLKSGLAENQAELIVKKFQECGLRCYVQNETIRIIEATNSSPATTVSTTKYHLRHPSLSSIDFFRGLKRLFQAFYSRKFSKYRFINPLKLLKYPFSFKTPVFRQDMGHAEKRTGKHVLRWLLFFVPGFHSRNILLRFLVTAALISFIVFSTATAFDKKFELLKAAILYDPYQYASNLCDEGRYASVVEFIDFRLSLPLIENFNEEGVNKNLIGLRIIAEERRSGIVYTLGEMGKGLIFGESDEEYGQIVGSFSDFLIGGPKTLIEQGWNYTTGEDVDYLATGLAGIETALMAVSAGPQASVTVPIKRAVGLLRASVRFLSKKMRNSISIIVKTFNKTQSTKSISKYFSSLKSVSELAASSGRKSAFHVLQYSDDIIELEKNAIKASKLGKNSGIILEHGGRDVLRVLDKHPPAVVNMAMKFGKPGMKLFKEYYLDDKIDSLISYIRWMRFAWTGKLYYHLKNFILMTPTPILIALILFSSLVVYKMWWLRPQKAG